MGYSKHALGFASIIIVIIIIIIKSILKHLSKSEKQKHIPGGESNPGLPRDKRGYSPLYYRGIGCVRLNGSCNGETPLLTLELKQTMSYYDRQTYPFFLLCGSNLPRIFDRKILSLYFNYKFPSLSFRWPEWRRTVY